MSGSCESDCGLMWEIERLDHTAVVPANVGYGDRVKPTPQLPRPRDCRSGGGRDECFESEPI